MIIVSQDKGKIINFDNVTYMYIVETYNGKRNYSIRCMITREDYTLIGEYQTEERAKEVLEEIIEIMQCKSTIEMNADGITSKILGGIYKMPKK